MSARDLRSTTTWWCSFYLLMTTVQFNRAQSPFSSGSFLGDPFLDVTNGLSSTPSITKVNKVEPLCISQGALAGAIIGTMLLSVFIGFLTWLVYLRPKFQELHALTEQVKQPLPAVSSSTISNHKHQHRRSEDDHHGAELPLDVTDYKFGTFPFRQSQIVNANGHHSRPDWSSRFSSSFRSMNMDKDSEMLDVELLDPSFGGLNFSVTGSMRTGIFVKEILDPTMPNGLGKSTSANKLKTGDRIVALTVCFQSIVYEDALTILSYASPYPVILRVQRPTHQTAVNVVKEKRSATGNTASKVKWRDEFEHYDNDPPSRNSLVQPIPSTSKVTLANPQSSTPQMRSSTKKSPSTAAAQTRGQQKFSSASLKKGNRMKMSSTNTLATSGVTTKRCQQDMKKLSSKSKSGVTTKMTTNQVTVMSSSRTGTATQKTMMTTLTNTMAPYRQEEDGVADEEGEQYTDQVNHSEEPTMPYYDSPYDYCYEQQTSAYQHLHQAQLNKNNNNSLSTETLTAVTPNLSRSMYTVHLSSSMKPNQPLQRRCQRRLSSPAVLSSILVKQRESSADSYDISFVNTDTFA